MDVSESLCRYNEHKNRNQISGGRIMQESSSQNLLTLYSDVRAMPVKWLWYPYIAVGKITLLQGDPGDGKSTMILNLIAEISKGGSTPDGKELGVRSGSSINVPRMIPRIQSNRGLRAAALTAAMWRLLMRKRITA